MSKWKQHEEVLKGAGVKTDRLAVLTVGQDTLIGEVDGVYVGEDLVDTITVVKNPKRILTLRMQTHEGIAMNTFIGPLEVVDGGEIALRPSIAYTTEDMSDQTKEQIFGLYAQHLDELQKNKALAAGIELAPGPLRPPNGLPNPNGRFGLR